MTRTPMEMSCWRGQNRRGPWHDFRVTLGDWLWTDKGLGSGMRKAKKRLKAEVRTANVLNRRIARYGSTVYE